MNSINQSAHFRNVDDLLFRGKNKAYGAYELRRDYDQRLQRSFLYFILFTGILSVSAGIYNFVQSRGKDYVIPDDKPIIPDTTRFIEVLDPPKTLVVEPPKTVGFSPPIIVTNANPIIEILPTQDIIEDPAPIGSTTTDGPQVAPTIGLSSGTNTGNISTSAKIEDFVDIMPEFPGGDQALMDYLGKKTEYPAELQAEGISGKVMLKFVVNEDGSISNITVIQPDNPRFNQAAIKVVKNMPKWIPGSQGGERVKVYFELPFSFTSQNDNE